MDFGTLLHKAQKNEVSKKEPIRYYSTKFEPPKKEQRQKQQLSVNVKKFLEKREQEEKQKRLEAQKKKEELLALRAKDKKAVKRVSVMLKRTKSANQSVIEDAIDSDNTAVTLAGPAQPDEDDYGYVSQEASAFYNKMMEKYSKMPEEPKFSLEKKKVSTNLNSTKDRVRAALEKEKEEAMMPHKRKRKTNSSGETGNASDSHERKDDKEEDQPEPKVIKIDKPKPKLPPPMNFAELMQLAAKKQFEPIVIEKKVKEEEPPMTKKQKREMERIREWQERKNEKNSVPSTTNNQKPELSNGKPIIKEKVLNKSGSDKINKSSGTSKLEEALRKDDKKTLPPKIEKPDIERKKIDWGAKHPGYSKMAASTNNTLANSSKQTQNTLKSNSNKIQKETSESRSNYIQKSVTQKSQSDKSNSRLPSESKQLKSDSKQAFSDKQKENKILSNERKLMNDKGEMAKPKQFPTTNLKPKQFPPADVRRNVSNRPQKMQINKGRIMDDDENDSEMDDFIDDGPEEEEDYSKYISEIFGYNKSKYVDYDEDDDLMESSFAQQMKEECISTKIGIMEDLEDIKAEEAHKRRKALMKKKLSKKK